MPVTQLGLEVRWCPGCDADRTVEIVQLTDDPLPVAVCADCGGGVDFWLPRDGEALRGRGAPHDREAAGDRGTPRDRAARPARRGAA